MNIYTNIKTVIKKYPIPGGICRTFFIPIEFVSNIPSPNPINGIIDHNLSLVSEGIFYELKSSQKDRIFTENIKDIDNGIYECRYMATIPWVDTDIRCAIEAMVGKKFLVVFYDLNGEWVLIGNSDSGCDFSYSYTTGDVNKQRMLELTFNVEQAMPCFRMSREAFENYEAYLTVNGEKLVVNNGLYKIEYSWLTQK